MSFSIEFQVTKLQEEEVKYQTAVEKDKLVLAGKLNLTDDCLVQMARSITILTQCYRIDNLVNSSGMMFWKGGGEMLCAAVIIASWHDKVIDN